MSRPQASSASTGAPRVPSVAVRALASVVILFHLAAVFVAPFSVPPTSDLGVALRSVFRPYIEINDLDHGYKFFDEPGPSFLVRYELNFADGWPTRRGTFPDLQEHRPRLLYHRHLMLADNLHRRWVEAEPPPPSADPSSDPTAARETRGALATGDRPSAILPPGAAEWFASRRALYDAYVTDHARHLRARYGATEVTLYGIERRIPTQEDIRDGKRLGAAEYTGETRLGTFRE
jgi:hypothetical protein